jgi:hypothetical protein
VRSSRPQLGLALIAVLAALAVAGCAAGSPQTGAKTFLDEHAGAAARLATSTKLVEAQIARLPSTPTRSQMALLARAATQARPALQAASEWSVAGAGEEGAEEEDVPRAETQVTEAAGELAAVMSALESYARAPSASALARNQSKLSAARGQWNEGISQLWYLAHSSHPPTL